MTAAARTAHPRAPRRRERRGFVFLMVLMLLIVGATMIAWSMSRITLQNKVAALQIDEYRRHHELMGLRDIVQHFASDRDHRDMLDDFATTAGIAHQIELPTGELISLIVHDGQGGVLSRLDANLAPDQRARLIDILARLPVNRPHLFRRVGPYGISFRAAPEEVIWAIVGENTQLGSTLLDLRSDPEQQDLTAGSFSQELMARGHTNEEVQDLQSIFTFTPSIFRIDAEVEDDRGVRRYVLTLERVGNIVPPLLDARALPRGDLFPPVIRPWDAEWAESPVSSVYHTLEPIDPSDMPLPPLPPVLAPPTDAEPTDGDSQ